MPLPQDKKITNGSEDDEVLESCLKLAALDKIGAKNSWNLHLLDHIDTIIEKSVTSGRNDFVKVSNVIGASVKIYAGRVDSLYLSMEEISGMITSEKKISTPSLLKSFADLDQPKQLQQKSKQFKVCNISDSRMNNYYINEATKSEIESLPTTVLTSEQQQATRIENSQKNILNDIVTVSNEANFLQEDKLGNDIPLYNLPIFSLFNYNNDDGFTNIEKERDTTFLDTFFNYKTEQIEKEVKEYNDYIEETLNISKTDIIPNFPENKEDINLNPSNFYELDNYDGFDNIKDFVEIDNDEFKSNSKLYNEIDIDINNIFSNITSDKKILESVKKNNDIKRNLKYGDLNILSRWKGSIAEQIKAEKKKALDKKKEELYITEELARVEREKAINENGIQQSIKKSKATRTNRNKQTEKQINNQIEENNYKINIDFMQPVFYLDKRQRLPQLSTINNLRKEKGLNPIQSTKDKSVESAFIRIDKTQCENSGICLNRYQTMTGNSNQSQKRVSYNLEIMNKLLQKTNNIKNEKNEIENTVNTSEKVNFLNSFIDDIEKEQIIRKIDIINNLNTEAAIIKNSINVIINDKTVNSENSLLEIKNILQTDEDIKFTDNNAFENRTNMDMLKIFTEKELLNKKYYDFIYKLIQKSIKQGINTIFDFIINDTKTIKKLILSNMEDNVESFIYNKNKYNTNNRLELVNIKSHQNNTSTYSKNITSKILSTGMFIPLSLNSNHLQYSLSSTIHTNADYEISFNNDNDKIQDIVEKLKKTNIEIKDQNNEYYGEYGGVNSNYINNDNYYIPNNNEIVEEMYNELDYIPYEQKNFEIENDELKHFTDGAQIIRDVDGSKQNETLNNAITKLLKSDIIKPQTTIINPTHLDYKAKLLSGFNEIMVKFASKPKMVNIRRLKETMKIQLNDAFNTYLNKTNVDMENIKNINNMSDSNNNKNKYVSFKKLVETYPKFHTTSVDQDINEVSVQIQFISLLHLANENNLELKKDDNFNDIFITLAEKEENKIGNNLKPKKTRKNYKI